MTATKVINGHWICWAFDVNRRIQNENEINTQWPITNTSKFVYLYLNEFLNQLGPLCDLELIIFIVINAENTRANFNILPQLEKKKKKKKAMKEREMEKKKRIRTINFFRLVVCILNFDWKIEELTKLLEWSAFAYIECQISKLTAQFF